MKNKMLLQCRVIEFTAGEKIAAAFGVADLQGRQIGVAVQKFEMRRIRQNKGVPHTFCRAGQLGWRYGFDGWCTRDGQKYGRHVWREYETEAERDAAAASYLDAARMRAARFAGNP